MNRNATIALAAAAIIGTAGGTFAAVQLAGDDSGNQAGDSPTRSQGTGTAGESSSPATTAPSETESPKPTEDTEDTGPDGPLWATDSAIHDGGTDLSFSGVSQVERIERAADGYLIADGDGYGKEPYGVYLVTEQSGYATPVAFVRGTWDVDQSGTQIIGYDANKPFYGIWDVASQKRTAKLDNGGGTLQPPAEGRAAFAGPDGLLALEWRSPAGDPVVLTSSLDNPEGGLALTGVSDWAISEDGEWFVGNRRNPVPSEETLCATGGSFALTNDVAKPWVNCDVRFYSGPTLTPSGDLALAVDAQTDGFGPGGFFLLSTADGSVSLSFETPKDAAVTEGVLSSDDSVTLRAALSFDGNGTVIYTCTLEGKCDEVVRSEADSVVAGAMN